MPTRRPGTLKEGYMLKQVFNSTHLSKIAGTCLLAGVLAFGMSQSAPVGASDHDDGETNIKSRNLNLTDLFVFREDWQTGVAADASNLIFIMNTNPRSLPRQQYFFNTLARYNFHVSRRANRDSDVTGVEDIRFEFKFSAPTENRQDIALDVIRFTGGQETSRETLSGGQTTAAPPLLAGNPAPVVNQVPTSAGTLSVFAGLREDPFFFDVDAFFRTRAAVAGAPGPARLTAANGGLLPTSATTSIDFAKGYNVNAVVMRVPISLLQAGGGGETTFDVWETITIPESLASAAGL
jgi:hypothetical protein